MTDFKIKQGYSTQLFTAQGVINPRLIIEPGCWYLCVDTASLYLGVNDQIDGLTLKRINRAELADPDINVSEAVAALQARLNELEDKKLFKRITSESDLPELGDAAFDGNITYYMPLADGGFSTYIYDEDSNSYFCTSQLDVLMIRTEISKALDDVLLIKLEEMVPTAVKQTLSTHILYGGDATPYDD